MPRVADQQARITEIVQAASELIATQGVESLSMRNVAKQAGCTIGLINHWFASKDDLLDGILNHVATEALARCSDALMHPDTPLEDIVAEFLPLDENRQSELRVWLAFWALSIGRKELRNRHSVRVAGVRKLLVDEMRKRNFDVNELEQLVDAVMAITDGIATNAIVDPVYWTIERQMATLRWSLKGWSKNDTRL